MNWTLLLWGMLVFEPKEIWVGFFACVLGSVPSKAAGLWQCRCHAALGLSLLFPVLLSLLLCRPALPRASPVPGCCSGAARPGLASQKASLATSRGRNTLTEDTSDPLTKRQLQDSPFFVPLQSGLDTKTNASNCNPEP